MAMLHSKGCKMQRCLCTEVLMCSRGLQMVKVNLETYNIALTTQALLWIITTTPWFIIYD